MSRWDVENQGGEPFDAAWTGSDSEAAAEIAASTKALTAAGFRIEPDDEDAQVIQVRV
ncbi:hypothetical protein [Streptosporangium sp. NPDC001681]|uniref:hypothetical protein n=1 Tax=Streptosporangium sp. NPDC001681 TaxID=3154395 RepID=UPI003326E6BB